MAEDQQPPYADSFVRTDSFDVALLFIAYDMTKRTLPMNKDGLYDADKLREELTKNIETVYQAWTNRNEKLDPSV